jgi:hypothetical protein
MASFLKQFIFEKKKPPTGSRRNSEILPSIRELKANNNNNDIITINCNSTSTVRDRRHSIPETGISSSDSIRDNQILDTILEVYIYKCIY